MAEQIPLPYTAAAPDFSVDSFMVTPSNETSVNLVLQSRMPFYYLCGPQACGKTHLTHIWAQVRGGRVIDAGTDIETLCDVAAIAVDNVDALLGTRESEEWLFHLYNLCNGHKPLLFAGLRDWQNVQIPDLRSRLGAAIIVELPEISEDDELRAGILVKQLRDFQIRPPQNVISYIEKHSERSAVALRDIVWRINHALNKAGDRNLTISLAKEVIEATPRNLSA